MAGLTESNICASMQVEKTQFKLMRQRQFDLSNVAGVGGNARCISANHYMDSRVAPRCNLAIDV